MFGQIRPVTVAASAGRRMLGPREASSARPMRSFTLRGRIRQPRRTCSVPCTATGTTGRAGLAAPGGRRRAWGRRASRDRMRVPSGKMQTVPPRSSTMPRGLHRDLVGLRRGGSGTRRRRERIHPCQRRSKSSTLATYCIGRRHGQGRPDHEGVEEAAVVGGDDQPALDAPEVLAAGPREAEPDQERRLEDHACDEVDQPVDAAPAGVVVVALEPLLADHPVGAWRRRRPRALVHAHAYTHTHVALLTRRRGCVPTERAFSYQASSTRRRSSARPGGSGVFASSGRSSIASHAASTRSGLPPTSPSRRRAAAERLDPRADLVGLDAQRVARATRSPRGRGRASRPSSAAASSRSSPRAGCRASAPASGRQRDEGRTRPSRARRRRGSNRAPARRGRARRAAGRAPRRSAPRRAAPQAWPPGWRAARRAPRRRGRARSSRWRAGGGRPALVISNGSAITSIGRT